MKILYISTSYFNENNSASIRNRAIITGFLRLGHEVYTLSPVSNGSKWTEDIKKEYCLERKDEYFGSSINTNTNLLWKIKKFVSGFMLYDGARRLLRNLNDFDLSDVVFDLVISSSDSKISHKIMVELNNKRKIKYSKWIQYWGDPFLIDINKTTKLPDLYVKYIEHNILKKADAILYTTPLTLKRQKELFEDVADKMFFIPTPYDSERIYKENNSESIILGYFGDYRLNDRDILPLAKVVESFEGKVVMDVVGNGDTDLSSFKHTYCQSRISYDELVKHEAVCDVLVCIGDKKSSPQLPGKIYNYSATNKKILFLYEEYDENTQYLEGLNRYFLTRNKIENIYDTIEEIQKASDIQYSPVNDFYCEEVVRKVIEIVNEIK